ncbi:hypothetical protein EV182_001252, partial [Spiromyces aspiralis]
RKKWPLGKRYIFTRHGNPLQSSIYKYFIHLEFIDETEHSHEPYIEISELRGVQNSPGVSSIAGSTIEGLDAIPLNHHLSHEPEWQRGDTADPPWIPRRSALALSQSVRLSHHGGSPPFLGEPGGSERAAAQQPWEARSPPDHYAEPAMAKPVAAGNSGIRRTASVVSTPGPTAASRPFPMLTPSVKGPVTGGSGNNNNNGSIKAWGMHARMGSGFAVPLAPSAGGRRYSSGWRRLSLWRPRASSIQEEPSHEDDNNDDIAPGTSAQRSRAESMLDTIKRRFDIGVEATSRRDARTNDTSNGGIQQRGVAATWHKGRTGSVGGGWKRAMEDDAATVATQSTAIIDSAGNTGNDGGERPGLMTRQHLEEHSRARGPAINDEAGKASQEMRHQPRGTSKDANEGAVTQAADARTERCGGDEGEKASPSMAEVVAGIKRKAFGRVVPGTPKSVKERIADFNSLARSENSCTKNGSSGNDSGNTFAKSVSSPSRVRQVVEAIEDKASQDAAVAQLGSGGSKSADSLEVGGGANAGFSAKRARVAASGGAPTRSIKGVMRRLVGKRKP